MPAAPRDERSPRPALVRARSALARVGQAEIAWTLVVLAIWLARMILPEQIAVVGLDLSWGKALAVAHERGLRLGTDYVFTSGPLGYFSTSAFHESLWWEKVLGFEVVFKLTAVVLTVLAARAIAGPLARGAYVLLLFAVPMWFDSFALLAISASIALLFASRARGLPLAVAALGVLATLALVKFTFLVLVAAALTVLVAGLALDGERRRAGLVLAGFAAWFLILWVAVGQSLLDLPSFLRWSTEVAAGYNEGESSLPDRGEVAWCGAWLCASYGALLLLHAAERPFSRLRVAEAVALAAAFCVAIKSGFVRGGDHTPFFFGWAAVAAYLAPAAAGAPAWSRATRTCLQIACTLIAFVGWGYATGPRTTLFGEFLSNSSMYAAWHADTMLDPAAKLEQLREEERVAALAHALPRTRAIVGAEPIDMLGAQQAIVIANGLAWTPRPVFQSYLTFTPSLLERNARFLEDPQSPRFLLQRLDPIDGHLATMEDGLSLQIVARDWVPRAYEKGYLLFERRPERAAARREVVLEREALFDETIDLGTLEGEAHVLSLDLRQTFAGRMRATAIRGAGIWMSVTDEYGNESRVRVRGPMIRSGAILDPFVRTHEEWAEWRLAGRRTRPARIRIETPLPAGVYERSFGLVLVRDDSLAPRPDAESVAMLEPIRFSPPPLRVESVVTAWDAVEDGLEVLVAPAPSRLEWEVEAGEHRVEGAYGIVGEAYRVHAGDGATFALVVEETGRPRRILLHRHLDPARIKEDRGVQRFSFEFRCDGPAKVSASTSPGPGGVSDFDWTYWAELNLR